MAELSSSKIYGDLITTKNINVFNNIIANQRIGIGTSSPSNRLHIYSDDGAPSFILEGTLNNHHPIIESRAYTYHSRIRTSYESSNRFRLSMSTNSGSTYNDFLHLGSGSDLKLGWQQDFIIKGSDGKIGIGTDSPDTQLHIEKLNSGGEGPVLKLQNPSGTWHSTTHLRFSRNVPSTAGGTDIMGEIICGSQSNSDGRSYMILKSRRQSQTDVENVITLWEDTVGIGSNFGDESETPQAKLDINGSLRANGDVLFKGDTDSNLFNLDYDNDRIGIGATSFSGYKLYVNGMLRVSSHIDIAAGNNIRAVGNFGLDMTIRGDGSATTGGDVIITGGEGSGYGDHGNVILSATYSGTKVGIGTNNPDTRLEVDGEVTATGFNDISDRRVKTNIKPLKDSLSIIEQLNGVSFDWNMSGINSVGLVAQDVEKVIPEVVHSGKIKGIQYGKIVPFLIEAIKELKKEIDDLKSNNNKDVGDESSK